ncbi:MAG: hypothetical protein QOE39_2972 [Bradyrhizobium sp.]|jgi:hypothetical protein|nr:hypothetical protein [Bradyrhizobium sp.]
MKPLRTALKLPRYCRRKPLKNGRWAYFFEPPTWARKQGCELEADALGQNYYDAAVARTENVLLPAFDSWRTGGLSDLAPKGLAKGSLDWLVHEFKKQQKWKDIDPHTKRTYEQGTKLFAARPNSVCVVHPKTGEEAWWPLFDETGKELFPELMPELDAIKEQTVGGLVFRRNHGHRRGRVPLSWITPRGGLDICVPRSSASFERPGFATSLASRRFATADLRKEQTPISPMPSCARQDAAGRRGSYQRTRSGPGSSLFPVPKSAAPSEQNQPVCRNRRLARLLSS